MAKRKTELEVATEIILEKRHIKKNVWEKEKLEEAQVKFLRGEYPELETFVLDRERQAMVYQEVEKWQ
ncbi:DUF5415 family protein [Enterococcus gilvus]|uniref:DUF5415 family protein n=1 Tax=Enterococcus gilvus TaxID=160453 RepID=UPI0028D6BE5E|nr:DUF5415 family protein [Enterococcus gilvus]